MAEKYDIQDKPDDFWDLADLVPKRKSSPKPSPARSTEMVEITLPSVSPHSRAVADVPLSERPVFPYAEHVAKPAPAYAYTVEGALVREVRIYPWKNEYTYYEQFRRHAEQLAPKKGQESPAVDFFSYMPQYTQLNRAQLDYYLWWRTNFRTGVCLPAAYSYLLLYLYELINLDEKHQDPQTGQGNMYRLWCSYRDTYPRLDVLVREWLCDFSLLHQLPPPKLDAAQYRTLLPGCRLKEFYVPTDTGGEALRTAMLLFCNNYDYTKSKFYRPDTKADYDRVLGGAIGVALTHLREESGGALTNAEGVSTVTRDTFAGAVCSWKQRRRIEVDFTSFSHTHELRYVMTDVLKYAENALRGALGIKSRLSIYAIGAPLREKLDAYLATALPKKQTHVGVRKAETVPDYEKRYDLPAAQISPERAAAIETASWQTTKRLIEAFGEPETENTPETGQENSSFASEPETSLLCVAPLSAPGDVPGEQDEKSPLAQALGDLVDFFPLALAHNRAAQRDFAAKHGGMLDAVADKINTVAGDILGDIVLEEVDGAYAVIEDYLEFLREQGVLS